MKHLLAVPDDTDIIVTHENISGLIHKTPVLTCESLSRRVGAELFFKCENFQKIGAFKMRGAASAAMRLAPEARKNGLATHSSGNHAQAVARAAQHLGVPAYIVMPKSSPRVKIDATRAYGAKITFCEVSQASRDAALGEVVAQTGAAFIHPFDNYDVIAGQATVAREFVGDVPDLDIITCPIGGGGLISGTALAAAYYSSRTLVYGAEPTAVDDAYRSFTSGELQTNTSTDTIADGLRTGICEKTFAIIRERVADVLTVTDEQIVAAMRLVWERMNVVIEPSSAVPVAMVLNHPGYFAGKRVGVILTGGNVDVANLPFATD